MDQWIDWQRDYIKKSMFRIFFNFANMKRKNTVIQL